MNIQSIIICIVSILLSSGLLATDGIAQNDPPFEITEDRVRCDNYDPFRQPLFGSTHLHTGLSFDASTRFVKYILAYAIGSIAALWFLERRWSLI